MTEHNHAYGPEVRIRRLDEQIAHLKVLWNSTEKDRADAIRTVQAWTERVMVHEAMLSSFQFRIEDYTAERDSLIKQIAPKVAKPPRAMRSKKRTHAGERI